MVPKTRGEQGRFLHPQKANFCVQGRFQELCIFFLSWNNVYNAAKVRTEKNSDVRGSLCTPRGTRKYVFSGFIQQLQLARICTQSDKAHLNTSGKKSANANENGLPPASH